MVPLKRILVATDFSKSSEAALSYGRELARAVGGSLDVMHVASDLAALAVTAEGFTPDLTTLQSDTEEAARKKLESLLTATDRQKLNATATVLTGSKPAEAIVTYAADKQVDLIVVGTHTQSRVEHLLLGSVAERVVRTARCPVLAVRPPS